MPGMQAAILNAPFRLPVAPGESDLIAKYFRVLGDRTRLRRTAGDSSRLRGIDARDDPRRRRRARGSHRRRRRDGHDPARAPPSLLPAHAEAEPVRTEVLYFDGCPNHEALLPRMREILA